MYFKISLLFLHKQKSPEFSNYMAKLVLPGSQYAPAYALSLDRIIVLSRARPILTIATIAKP